MTSVGKVQQARGPRLLRLYGGLLDDDYLNAGDSGVRSARGWLASEAYNSLFSEIVGVFRQFRREHPGKPRESTTEQKLIQRVLTALGWTYGDRLPLGPPGTGGKPDYPLFTSQGRYLEVAGEQGSPRYWTTVEALCEAKRWGADLDANPVRQQRSTGPADLSERPAHQIMCYLWWAKKPPWGILTNGAKWRLYGRQESLPDKLGKEQDATAAIECLPPKSLLYYEFDLDEFLQQQDLAGFDYFLNFFHAHAHFRDPAQNGTSVLDRILAGSKQWERDTQKQRKKDARDEKERREHLEQAKAEVIAAATDGAYGQLRKALGDHKILDRKPSDRRDLLSAAYSRQVVDEVLKRMGNRPDS